MNNETGLKIVRTPEDLSIDDVNGLVLFYLLEELGEYKERFEKAAKLNKDDVK